MAVAMYKNCSTLEAPGAVERSSDETAWIPPKPRSKNTKVPTNSSRAAPQSLENVEKWDEHGRAILVCVYLDGVLEA